MEWLGNAVIATGLFDVASLGLRATRPTLHFFLSPSEVNFLQIAY
jgi:hypothetical protein